MSSVDDKRKSTIPRESGKRLYVSDKNYPTQMRKPTIMGMARKEPWSEFEKPYWEDSYEDMEYLMWNYPGFPNHDYEMSWDNPSFPTTEGAGLGGGGFLVFECQTYGGFCPGDTRNIGIRCSHPITGIALTSPVLHGGEFSISLASPTSIAITAAEDAGGGVEIDVFMRTAAGVPGSHESILIGSAPDCENCDTASEMEADPDNPTVAVDSTNYTINVLYGVGPFAWSVQADDSPDVAVQNAVTSGRSNTLIVTDGCGTIIITVVDSCGTEVEIVILGDGAWQDCQSSGRGGSGCGCTAPHSSESSYGDLNPFYFNFGGKRWRLRDGATSDCYGISPVQCCCDPAPCGATANCLPNFNIGTMCLHDGAVTPPCLNPCSGGCGTTIRTGQGLHLDVWECA